MQKLIVFNSISLDGYFTDAEGSMSWAHNAVKDEEWNNFVAGNSSGGGTLVFGRVTYDLMVSYWPTPMAKKNDPVVAGNMNKLQKIVFSRTLDRVSWNNTKLIKENMAEEIGKMKKEPGPGMAILGSGSIVSQLTQERLIDEYQIVVVPIVLGVGRTLFEGIKGKLDLKLISTRTFKNGNVFLSYKPL